jgi:hypothetical protein
MAKRRSIDLAAAMAADLKSHDPMSTKPHETESSAPHENMSEADHQPISSGGHEPRSNTPHEKEGAASHEPMRSREQPGSYVPPSRSGMKRIQGYFSPRVKRQFRLLALNADLSEEELVGRALNLLFKAEGLPEIAFDGKDRSRGDG